MKVAKLVTFTITTRVIVDTPDPDDMNAIEAAQKQILNNGAAGYLTSENVDADGVVDDTDCPYGSLEKDK